MVSLTQNITNSSGLEGFLKSSVHGALTVEATEDGIRVFRLPSWTRTQYGGLPFMERVSSETSGARLELVSRASWIEIELTFTRVAFEGAGLPARPAALTLTTSDGTEQTASFEEGHVLLMKPDMTHGMVPGKPTRVRFDLSPATSSMRGLTLWLPHNCQAVIHRLSASDELFPAEPGSPRWVHYGSSISQCSEATTPLGVWPVVAARKLGLNLLNLGLSGSAHLDPFVARSIRDYPASLITLKMGINIVNSGTFRARSFAPAVHGFLDTIREGQPKTPIVVISPIICPPHEETPGPTAIDNGVARGNDIPRFPNDGHLTLKDIRRTLASLVHGRSATDNNLYYLDGLRLFDADDIRHLPDLLHPDPTGYHQIGERFAALARTEPWLPS